jgi:hypothetical protein
VSIKKVVNQPKQTISNSFTLVQYFYIDYFKRHNFIFKWISRRKINADENQQQTWLKIVDIKDHIVAQLDSDNDGFVYLEEFIRSY